MENEHDYEWYSGTSDERYDYGPFPTREAALEEVISSGDVVEAGQPVYLCQAANEPVKLSDYIREYIIEDAEDSLADSERTGSEYDEGPWFVVTQEQEQDLIKSIKAACDQWQKDHNLVFTCATFSHAKNLEAVIVTEEMLESTDGR